MAPNHRNLLQLLLCLSTTLVVTSSAKAPAIIVFGDSTVDSGNNNNIDTIVKSNFPPYGRDFTGGKATGRFCNGRLPTDFISEALGLGPTVPAYLDTAYNIKDFATGVCFASAGTGLENATSDLLSVIPLWKELEYFKDYQRKLRAYLGRDKAKTTINGAVYIISIGSNDFLLNYYGFITGRFMQFTVDQYSSFLVNLAANFVTDIYRLGARKIIFFGLIPLGCLPLERTINVLQGGACVEEYNKATKEFNAKLQAMVARLCERLPGLRLRYTDLYNATLRIIHNPSLYGYENAIEGCCGTGKYEMAYLCNQLSPFTCSDADKYFFWDSFHPTERVNQLLAQLVLSSSLAEFI